MARRGLTRWIIYLLVGVVMLTFVSAGTWATHEAEQRKDQFQLLLLGRCVYEGGRLYVDCWENKPPGVAWINALGFAAGGGRAIGPWLLPGLTVVLSLTVLVFTAANVLSAASSLFAVFLAAMVMTLRVYDAPSVHPDTYSAAFALIAVSLWLAAVDGESRIRLVGLAFASGLSWAAAVLCKQTGAAGLVALTFVAIIAALIRSGRHRRWLAATAVSWAALAVVAAGVAGLLHRQGTLPDAWEAVYGFNKSLWSVTGFCTALLSWDGIWSGHQPIVLLLWLALLGTVTTLRVRGDRGLAPALVCALLLWWLAESVFAQLGPSGSMRYWQAALPPLIWLSAAGIFHLEDSYQRLGRHFRTAFVILCLTVLALLGRPLYEHYRHGLASSYLYYSDGSPERARLESIGGDLSALVPEDRSIYVWSYDPGIYYFSRRRPASRFTYPRSEQQMDEILSDLASTEAFVLLVPEHSDATFDRWCDDECLQRLEQILNQYTPVHTPWGYQMYLRE